MTDDPPYDLVRSFPAAGPFDCHGKSCDVTIQTGESVHLVVRVADFARDPADESARAYLCDVCVEKLGDRLHRLDPDRPREPVTIPGPDVEPF